MVLFNLLCQHRITHDLFYIHIEQAMPSWFNSNVIIIWNVTFIMTTVANVKRTQMTNCVLFEEALLYSTWHVVCPRANNSLLLFVASSTECGWCLPGRDWGRRGGRGGGRSSSSSQRRMLPSDWHRQRQIQSQTKFCEGNPKCMYETLTWIIDCLLTHGPWSIVPRSVGPSPRCPSNPNSPYSWSPVYCP